MTDDAKTPCAYQETGETVRREYPARLALTGVVAGIAFLVGFRAGAVLWWLAMAGLLQVEIQLYRKFLSPGAPFGRRERAALAVVSFLCASVYTIPALVLLAHGARQSYFAAASFMAGTLIHLLVHNSANRLIFASCSAPMATAFLVSGLFASFEQRAILPALTVVTFIYAMIAAYGAKEAGARKIAAALELAEKERAAALKASAAKSAFLAKMSHELRTPLNGVLGSAAALKAVAPGAEERERLEAIEASGEALLTLLTDALDVTRIEAGGLTLVEAPADLRETVGAPVARWRPAAAAKGLALTVDLSALPATPASLDAVRLAQAIGHLLSNAVKFTDAGAILVKAGVESGRGLIEVSDTGCGLSSEEQGRIFRPFEQADNSITRKHGGAGLGLALVAEIARAMGGAATVRSEKGKGATFSFSFAAPAASGAIAIAESPLAPTPALEGPEEHQIPAARLSILLVEDNEINRRVVHSFLRSLSAEVVDAENGAVALQRLAERAFDLVLMDLHMPVMDGLAATRAIRAAAAPYSRTPIVALTAAVSEEDRAASFSAGVDDFLGKPVKREKLAATVRRLTDDRWARAV